MEHNFSKELFKWLNENEDANAITKINMIHKYLGSGSHTHSMLEYEFPNGDIVELHVNTAEYENEDYPEEVTYAVEVNTYALENFKYIKDAHAYYKEKINEHRK